MNTLAGLTRRRKDVLDALGRFVERHERPPSIGELGAMVGLSRTTIYQHLRALKRLGFVEYTRGVGCYSPRDALDDRARHAKIAAECFMACASIARRHTSTATAADEMEKAAAAFTDVHRAANSATSGELASRTLGDKRATVIPLTFGRARLLLSEKRDHVSTLDEW